METYRSTDLLVDQLLGVLDLVRHPADVEQLLVRVLRRALVQLAMGSALGVDLLDVLST
jgi:hypothetical protein